MQLRTHLLCEELGSSHGKPLRHGTNATHAYGTPFVQSMEYITHSVFGPKPEGSVFVVGRFLTYT